MYGGDSKYSLTTNDYVEFTITTTAGQTLGLLPTYTTNAGYGYVTIDGQASLANLLSDDGSGNKYIDFYGNTTPNLYKNRRYAVPVADNLSAGTHTIRITVAGVKNASSTGYRVYIDGIAVYNTNGASTDTIDGDFIVTGKTQLTSSGDFEYTYYLSVSGVGTYFGTATHDKDTLNTFSVALDGVTQTLNNLDIYTGSNLNLTETSTLGDGTSPNIASISRGYAFSSSGLDFSNTTTWNNPLPIAIAYWGMFPILDGSTTSTVGRFRGNNTTYNLTTNDDSLVGNVNTTKGYEYNASNSRLYSMEITGLDSHVNNDQKMNIWDKTAPSYNKLYYYRQTSATLAAPYTPSAGEVWSSVNKYRYYYDTAAPTGVSLSSPADSSSTNDTTPTLSWAAGSDAESEIDHYVVTVDGSDNTVAAGITTYTTGSLSAGSHTWSVKAYDYLGNYSTTSSRTFTVDTTTPATTDNVDTSWHNSNVTVTLTCTDTGGSGCANTYYTTDGSTPTTASSQGTSFTLSTDGTYTIKYFSVDNANNQETVKTATNTVKIDKTTPSNPTLSSPTGYTKDNTKPTLVFKKSTDSGSSIASYTVSLDSGKNRSLSTSGISANGNGASSYVWKDDSSVKVEFLNENDSDSTNDEIHVFFKDLDKQELSEGKHTWTVTAYDNSSNSTSQSADFYIDKTSPSISDLAVANVSTVISSVSYNLDITNRMPSFSGLAADNYQGSTVTNSNGTKDTFDKVSSGPQTLTLTFKKQKSDRTYADYSTKDFSLSDIQDSNGDKKSARFYITTPFPLVDGYYQVTIVLKDSAGNSYSQPVFYIALNSSGINSIQKLFSNNLDTKVTEQNTVPAVTTEEKQQVKENGYTVKVKVVDTKNQPVAGAKVTIHSKIQETTTDKNGDALFNSVEPGQHKILIAYSGYSGEQSVNLTGDVKEFDFNIQVKQTNAFLNTQVMTFAGIMGLVIIVLVVLLIKAKRKV